MSLFQALALFASLWLYFSIAFDADYSQIRQCEIFSEYHTAFIPACGQGPDALQDCRLKVEERFPPIQEELFSDPNVRERLHDFKDRVGWSWYHFNQAKRLIGEIRQGCKKADLFTLRSKTMDYAFHLQRSLVNADEAITLTFEIVALEKKDLEEEDISLILGESLGVSYKAFINNADDFKANNPHNKTFASRYLRQLKNFEEKVSGIEDRKTFLPGSGLADLLSAGVNIALGDDQNTALLKGTLLEMINSVDSLEKRTAIAKRLSDFNSFGLFRELDSLVGYRHSIAFEFMSLMSDDAKARQEAELNCHELGDSIESLSKETSYLIESLSAGAYSSFDNDFMSDLYSLLGKETAIRSVEFSVSEVSSFKVGKQAELRQLDDKFTAIEIRYQTKQDTLGKRLSELKSLEKEFSRLKASVKSFSEKVVSSLESLCDERVELIEEELAGLELPENERLLAGSMRRKLEKNLGAYKSAKSIEEKLARCKPVIDDFQALAALVEENTDLNQYFSAVVPNAFFLEEKFFKASQLFQALGILGGANRDISYEFQWFEQFFLEGKIIHEKASASANELEEALDAFSLKAEKTVLELFQERLEQAEAKPFSFEKVKAGQESSALAFLELENHLPFAIEYPFSVKIPIPLNAGNAELAAKPDFVSGVRFLGKAVEVKFSSFPQGKALVKFMVKELLVEVLEEKIYVKPPLRESRVEINHLILLANKSKAAIPQVLVECKLLNAAIDLASLQARSNNQLIDFNFSGNTATLMVENISDRQEIILSYFIPNPVDFNIIEHETVFDQTTFERHFDIAISSNLPIDIPKNTFTKLPLVVPEKNVANISLRDESGKALKVERLADTDGLALAFKLDGLPAKRTKSMHLAFQVKNFQGYWDEIVSALKEKIEVMKASPAKAIAGKAAEFEGKLDRILKTNLKDRPKISELEGLAKEVESLFESQALFDRQLGELNLLKDSLGSKLENARRNLESSAAFSAEEKEELAERISAAELASNEVLALEENGQLDKALAKMHQALALLNALPKPHRFESLKENEAVLWDKWLGLEAQALQLGLADSNSLQALKEDIIELDQEIIASLSAGDFWTAEQSMNELNRELGHFDSALLENARIKATAVWRQVTEFKNLIHEKGLDKKIDLFEKLFRQANKNPLKLNYLLPLTEQDLKGKTASISKLKKDLPKKTFTSFEKYFKKNKFAEALAEFQEFGPAFEPGLKQALSLQRWLDESGQRLETDASAKFSSALKSSQGSTSLKENESLQKLVEKARDALNEKDFINSIKYSDKVISLLSLSEAKKAFAIPLAIYPVVALIALAAFMKFNKRKGGKRNSYQAESQPLYSLSLSL